MKITGLMFLVVAALRSWDDWQGVLFGAALGTYIAALLAPQDE